MRIEFTLNNKNDVIGMRQCVLYEWMNRRQIELTRIFQWRAMESNEW